MNKLGKGVDLGRDFVAALRHLAAESADGVEDLLSALSGWFLDAVYVA